MIRHITRWDCTPSWLKFFGSGRFILGIIQLFISTIVMLVRHNRLNLHIPMRFERYWPFRNLLRREFRFQGLIMLYLLIIRLEQKHMRFVSVTEFLISMYFWGVIKVAAWRSGRLSMSTMEGFLCSCFVILDVDIASEAVVDTWDNLCSLR